MSGKGRDSDDKSEALLCLLQVCASATFQSEMLDFVFGVLFAYVTKRPSAKHRAFILL